jgi:hypothetical protein
MDRKLEDHIHGSRPPDVSANMCKTPLWRVMICSLPALTIFDGLLVLSEDRVSKAAGKVRICNVEVMMC